MSSLFLHGDNTNPFQVIDDRGGRMVRLVFFLFLVACCSLAQADSGAPQGDRADGLERGAASGDKEAGGSPGSVPPEKPRTLDDLFAQYQPYLGNISAYEPMYFLVGTQPEKSKFQFSFKYRFFNPAGNLAVSQPWLTGLHFAYTQTSFWDLKSDSAPFEDTSYKPELFYLSSDISWLERKGTHLFVQGGFQHESNGQADTDSRSTNYVYVKPIFILYHPDSKIGLQVAPKVWGYLGLEKDSNADLPDYRGYFDLEIKAGRAASLVMESHFRWARKGPSIQVDLTYPLHEILFHNLDFYLQVEYVNSLAENLKNYRERTEALRLGIAIVR
jgi:phospholipase A1